MTRPAVIDLSSDEYNQRLHYYQFMVKAGLSSSKKKFLFASVKAL